MFDGRKEVVGSVVGVGVVGGAVACHRIFNVGLGGILLGRALSFGGTLSFVGVVVVGDVGGHCDVVRWGVGGRWSIGWGCCVHDRWSCWWMVAELRGKARMDWRWWKVCGCFWAETHGY